MPMDLGRRGIINRKVAYTAMAYTVMPYMVVAYTVIACIDMVEMVMASIDRKGAHIVIACI